MKTLSKKCKIEENAQIVVFYFPFKVISGGPIYLTNLALSLSKNPQFSVFYIEYEDGIGRNYLAGSRVGIIDYYEDYVFELFPENEIILITPIYWGNRVPVLNMGSKIVFFNWHNLCIPSLREALQCNDDIIKDFLSVVSENSAEFYCDKAHWAAQEKFGVHFPEIYVPITVPERKRTSIGTLADGKINIAVLGRLVIDKIYAITDLIDNICETVKRDENINIFIIGDGDCRDYLDKYLNNQKINIIFKGTLSVDEINDFLANRVDLLFAMGTSVLEGAVACIPRVVIPNDIRKFKCNRYSYLFECKDYLLGWGPDQIDDFGIETHTIRDIIHDIYDENKKNELGLLCRKYYQDNHMDNEAYFFHAFTNSTLTYEMYLSVLKDVKRNAKKWAEENIQKILLRNKYKNIVIWGAGKGGKKLMKTLAKMELSVKKFVDKNAGEILYVNDIEVKGVDDIDKENEVVLISLLTYDEAIPRELSKRGFEKEKDFLYVYFPNY